MRVSDLSYFSLLALAVAQKGGKGGKGLTQPGGQINSPEALASPGTGPFGAVMTSKPTFDKMGPKFTIAFLR
jgi:hypothetical protein